MMRPLLSAARFLIILIVCSTPPAAVIAASTGSAKCLVQKVLISCAPADADKSPGTITCGGSGGGGGGGGSSLTPLVPTEVLLDWNNTGVTARTPAVLSLELSKPATGLSVVLLDLSEVELCTAVPKTPVTVGFRAPAGTKLAIRGLSLPSVTLVNLLGNVAVNSKLLAGLPALSAVLVSRNNISVSAEPRAKFTVSGAPSLVSLRILASIHSVTYDTPILDSLPSLSSVTITGNNMLLLKTGSLVGLPALRFLYLQENNILELGPNCLAGLTVLEHLFLNQNGIRRISDFVFADLGALKRLSLANNRLEEVQPNALTGLVSLEFLDLSNNQLTRLPVMLFAQQHGLRMLNLQQNRQLLAEGSENDTFCPLEKMETVWTDGQIECQRFGAERFVQIVNAVRRKKYACDVKQIEPTQRPCHNWVERLASRMKQRSSSVVEELPALTREKTPSQLNIILLIVFGVICFVHVITTAVTIYVCRRMRERRRASHGLISKRKSPSVSSPEEERSLDASPGVAKESASALGGRLHASGNGGASGKKQADKNASGDRLNVRDKSYDFNEDENRA